MKLAKWSPEELVQTLKLYITSEGAAGVGVSELVPLCEEVTRRQFNVRIDCDTARNGQCHQCRKTLVIDDTVVAEWEDHFELDATAPGRAPWASQLGSSFPLPEAAVRALGIVDPCVDPAACLEDRQ
jgi:hypothetical protein